MNYLILNELLILNDIVLMNKLMKFYLFLGPVQACLHLQLGDARLAPCTTAPAWLGNGSTGPTARARNPGRIGQLAR